MNYIVRRVSRNDIRDFIESHHYSHSINGCISDYCFALYDGLTMLGAMFYGRMAMANQWKKYSNSPDNVIELRRLVLIDDTRRNAESFFIGASLKMLAKIWNADGIVVSYADSEYFHSGIIYKASNFICLGKVPGAKVIMYDGKKYHDKTIRTKYKGELKPFAKRIKEALDNGLAYYKKCKEKYVYVYYLNKKRRKLEITKKVM